MYAGLLPESNAFSSSFSRDNVTFDPPTVYRNTEGYPRSMKERLIAKDAEKFRKITEKK